MKKTHIADHPLIIDSLSHLRNKNTNLQKFRHHSDKICQLLFAEATRGLRFKKVNITTPLTKMKTQKLADEIVVIPILRAGIAMLFGAMQFLPKSKIGFVGMERDEKTASAKEYYCKLPKIKKNTVVIVVDPMIATGGSILHLLKKISKEKPKEIRVVSVVSAPKGIEIIHNQFPTVDIYTGAVDKRLNKTKYIVPGLGDYGDRYFGTN